MSIAEVKQELVEGLAAEGFLLPVGRSRLVLLPVGRSGLVLLPVGKSRLVGERAGLQSA